MEFNNRSRKVNAILASSSGIALQVVQILGNFVYRTVFLTILTKEYLGINGLFANILHLFSVVDLGVGAAILYSMYKPFSQKDIPQIGALVNFYKKVYRLVILATVCLSLCCYPFMDMLVDRSQVPQDVNLTFVYFLFVCQSVTDYLFAYKYVVLTADQKPYLQSVFTGIMTLLSYAVRLTVLLLTSDYELTLLSGIVSNLVMNGLFSLWISRKYADIFRTKGNVPQEAKREIYKNTIGILFHKVGSIVVTGTDNIILTKYIGLVAAGIYSNYAMIVSAINDVLIRIFYGILPVVTNYTISQSAEDTRRLFNKLLYLNLWLSSFTTVCLYLLLNPFISVWLDESFLLTEAVVAVLCLQHYLQTSRLTADNFISSCGLFARDKIRPLIESALNLVISILLVKKIGIAGVFVGTCVSVFVTCYWRAPYLVFKHSLGKGLRRYWLTQLRWFALTVAICVVGSWFFHMIPNSIPGFLVKMMVAGLGSNLIIFLVTFRTEEFQYFLSVFKKKLR